MAIEEIKYLSYTEAVLLHIELMRSLGEMRYGVFERSLVESSLARPQQAAVYEHANLLRQAATLCFGLIKNHPWVGGNKRTATALLSSFLWRNRLRLASSAKDNVEMVLAIESGRWGVDEMESWLRQHTVQKA